MSTELIMIGFDDTRTVFLARAALARQHEGFGMATEDAAMVLRTDDGSITVHQGLSRDGERNAPSTFWETMADLLFVPESSESSVAEARSEMRDAVGFDTASTSRAVNQLKRCKTALLVRARGLAQRESVFGLLQGFEGVVVRLLLGPECQLTDSPEGEGR
jgi:uncharacterized membrane protein